MDTRLTDFIRDLPIGDTVRFMRPDERSLFVERERAGKLHGKRLEISEVADAYILGDFDVIAETIEDLGERLKY